MAKNEYDDELELFADLEDDLADIMSNEVDKVVKEFYEEQVDHMYKEFKPEVYCRRYENGGFKDKDNWQSEVKNIKDTIEYTMENTTGTNGDNKGDRLDEYIEEGIYGGHGYVKRPAYERSMERIESENVVEEAMENQLKKAGWEFE